MLSALGVLRVGSACQGGEGFVVGEEKDAAGGSLAGVAEGEFRRVPGLAGPGAAVDEKLAVFRELVQQGEAGGELALEEFFGVIDEGTLFLGSEPWPKASSTARFSSGLTGLRTRLPKIRSQVPTQFSRSLPVTSQLRGIPWKYSTSLGAWTSGTQRAFST